MYSFGRVQSRASDYVLIQALHVDATDGNDDLLIYCPKLNQPCAAGPDRLNGLHYIALKERQDPCETCEGLTCKNINRNTQSYLRTIEEKFNKRPLD